MHHSAGAKSRAARASGASPSRRLALRLRRALRGPRAAAAADTSEFKIDMTDLDFSLCALDVATEVDPFDEQMGKSIEEKCPDLKPVHDNYVKSAK